MTKSLALILFLSGTIASQAHLTLTLSGTPDSNIVSYTATGSMTVDVSQVVSVTSGSARLPIQENGQWTSTFANSLGNILSDYPVTMHDDLILSSAISLKVDGLEIGVWDTIDLDPSSLDGDDDIRLDPTASINYPTVTQGQVVSWSGSGTFSLETIDPSYDTFGEVFTTGTYVNAINSTDNYIVIVEDASIPEPGSTLLLGIAGIITLFRRNRQ